MKRSEELLELDKILAAAAEHAALEGGKALLIGASPVTDLSEARRLLDETEEAETLLYRLGAGRAEYFPPLGDRAERAAKGATLSCAELTDTARLLRSARLLRASVLSLADESIVLFRGRAERLPTDERLEGDIFSAIVGENELADTASDRLFSIRREIRLLGERIRARLQQYLSGEEKKYLQDGIVTVRGDRYVIPVKAEYKRSVRGFVHDRSQSGATVFIEPEEVLEMNNELRGLMLDEREETERILAELSARVGKIAAELESAAALLAEADAFFARAEYGYSLRAVKPKLNAKGVVDIVRGRHPLLDKKTAVPVSVAVGEEHRFLIISGANTGGKTVTLKMCGLFCLMAACGLFVPAEEGTRLTVSGVYCDVGDSQSIEENLSTFSSHVVNLREILREAGENDFVLIDEPGGGTDPEEGQALARAVLAALMEKGCRGIVTTHYSALKEFAYHTEGLVNGCMEFDAEDFRPLYRLRIGAPGASNALAICTRLGLPAETVERARGYLSEGARAFEATLRAAEEERVRAAELVRAAGEEKRAWEEKNAVLAREEEKLAREKEKLFASSKAEARRIVQRRTAEAEEILAELRDILHKAEIGEGDLIRARTLKNKLSRAETEEETPVRARPLEEGEAREGMEVLVGSMNARGEILSLHPAKRTAEVRVGALRVQAKYGDLFAVTGGKKEEREVRVVRDLSDRAAARPELDLIGKTVAEMEPELEKFLDSAVLANFREVRIVHGMGTGKLRAAVHAALRRHSRVESFRLGRYGEGESGVTIVTLR